MQSAAEAGGGYHYLQCNGQVKRKSEPPAILAETINAYRLPGGCILNLKDDPARFEIYLDFCGPGCQFLADLKQPTRASHFLAADPTFSQRRKQYEINL